MWRSFRDGVEHNEIAPEDKVKPFAPKTRVTVTLRGQEVIADAQAKRDGERIEVIVELWDSHGRTLDWTLSREELSLVARAAGRACAAKSPPGTTSI